VVRAAVELADADGLEGVSMSRVARRLGFTTMSLYRHVRSKDELLMLMLDAAVGVPDPPDPRAEDWRPALERWWRALVAVLQRHPWVLQIPISGPPITPSQLAWLDRGLQALADTALSEPEKAAVILLLNGHAFWEARLSLDLGRAAGAGGGTAGDREPSTSALLRRLVDAERFPALRKALDAGIFADQSRNADIAFGLERILDGVERLVVRHAAERHE
jgi:AcrR family transcriptional regulator